MKKTNFLRFFATFAVAVTVFSLVSCSKEDDTPVVPPGGGEEEGELPVIDWQSPIKSDKEALAVAAGAYYDWARLSSSFSFLLESATESTISFEGAETAGGPEVSRFETTKNNSYANKLFRYFYVSVGEANKAIARLDSSYANGSLTQATIDLAKGRAKFIRGLDYLYLTQLYGEVPVFTSPNATDAERTTRKPIDEVYTQAVKDLTEAEALLPDFDPTRSNPSKGAANAILARAYLQWASNPLSQQQVAAIAGGQTDPAAPTWNNERLQKVVEYADKVISSGNFALEPNFENLWGVQAENRSTEHIFTIHHDGDGNGDAQGNHQTHCPFTFGFDLYTDNHIGPADVSLLSWFEPGDKRKRFSIADSLYNADEKTGAGNTPQAYKKYGFTFPVTSPRYAKWIHRYNRTSLIEVAYDQGVNYAGQPNNINRVEIRLADVLLYKAEAKFYLNSGDKGLAEVNQIRARAGLDPLATLTKEALEKEYKLEQFFEQRNWVNLTRWRTLIQTVRKVSEYEYFKPEYQSVASIVSAHGPAVSGTNYPTSTNYPFFAKIYTHLHKKYDNVTGKFYRFPIPKQYGEDVGITVQNPGY
ncbi:MAG: RagB/SusD family nutrient uptake outer membrane protein [Prevotellaceae bacterium]|jgi:hypothetical protein|nr:RagB/SusD family nutrient uptake outer membrane protein [Prevotellaceae bacterium]